LEKPGSPLTFYNHESTTNLVLGDALRGNPRLVNPQAMAQMKKLLLFLLVVAVSNASVITTVKLKNNGSTVGKFAVRFHIYNPEADPQYANADYVKTVKPGETATFSPTTEEFGEGWVIQSMSSGFISVAGSIVGNSYIANEGAVEEFTYGNISAEPPFEALYEGGMGGENEVHAPPLTSDYDKTLWAVGDTSLTADVYREGVDKIVAATGAVAAAASASGGSSGVTMENTEFMHTKGREFFDQTPTTLEYTEMGNAAKAEVASAISGAKATPAYGTAPEGGNSLFSIPLGTTGHTLNFDPAESPLISKYATFCKAAIAWLVTTLFGFYVWNWGKDLYMVLAQTTPAKGNTVAGSGGQITSLVVAIGITAVIVAFPVAFWAAADSGMTWGYDLTINPIQSASAATGVGEMAVYLFNFFLPVGTMLSALTAYLIILKAGLVLVAGAQTLIRYIVA